MSEKKDAYKDLQERELYVLTEFFKLLGDPTRMWINCVIWQYNLAWEITEYLKQHPKATVVKLGARLSCLWRQMGNTTNPWYCLDMDNVIALREKHVPL